MDIIAELQNKEDKKAYTLVKELVEKSAESSEYYSYFDDFISLLDDKSSYIRTRGLVLSCAQARWDKEEKLQTNIELLLSLLHDEKPTVVRQCLAVLHEVVLYKPELTDRISLGLTKIDVTKYKESMEPLIKKDIADLKRVLSINMSH